MILISPRGPQRIVPFSVFFSEQFEKLSKGMEDGDQSIFFTADRACFGSYSCVWEPNASAGWTPILGDLPKQPRYLLRCKRALPGEGQGAQLGRRCRAKPRMSVQPSQTHQSCDLLYLRGRRVKACWEDRHFPRERSLLMKPEVRRGAPCWQVSVSDHPWKVF